MIDNPESGAFTHIWYWHSRMGERIRKGLKCRVIVRGRRNSVLVEMEDGEKVVTSRYAVREEKTEMGNQKNMQVAIQRTLVQTNPDARFLVRGYYTGDFLGAIADSGFTGAEFVVERPIGIAADVLKVGDRVWVPFATYITLSIDGESVARQ